MGYYKAGFDVTGVDVNPQFRYPFSFVQADALVYLAEHGNQFDAIHASPPCQFYSRTRTLSDRVHPDMISDTRNALKQCNPPYVVENVEDAAPELKSPTRLCGAYFGLRTYRHRLFETSFNTPEPPHPPHSVVPAKMGGPLFPGDFYVAVGHFSGVDLVREDMGVPWMSREGVSQSIPPAYTEYIGKYLREAVDRWFE